jgi:hypothetical protein
MVRLPPVFPAGPFLSNLHQYIFVNMFTGEPLCVPLRCHLETHVTRRSCRRELFVRVSNYGRDQSRDARGDAGLQESLGRIRQPKDGTLGTRTAGALFQSELFFPVTILSLTPRPEIGWYL